MRRTKNKEAALQNPSFAEVSTQKDIEGKTGEEKAVASGKNKSKKNAKVKVKKAKNEKAKTKEGRFKRLSAKLKDMLTYVGEQTLPLRRQIRFKLVVAFFVPAILIVALGVLSIILTQGTIEDNYKSSSQGNIENSAKSCEQLMLDIQTKASQIANYTNFYAYYVNFGTNDVTASNDMFVDARTFMQKLVQGAVGIDGVYSFGGTGKPMTSKQESPSDSLYKDFTASEDFTNWSSRQKSVGGTNMAWVGLHTTIDKDANIKPELYSASFIRTFYMGDGYITIDLLTAKVTEILQNSIASDKSVVAFITSDGRETIATGKDKKLSLDEGKTVFYGTKFYEKAVNSKKVTNNEYVSGGKYLFVYSKIGDTGAMICTLIPKSDIMSKLNLIRSLTIVFVLISFIIAVFIGLMLSTDIGKALNKFSGAFKHISAGDLTVRINTKRKDEFGALAHDMDDTLDKIQELISDMTNFGHNVSDAAYKVSGASGEILSSINEVSATVNVMSQGVHEQAKDTEKSFLQMTEFAGQIGEAYTDTESVGKVADNTQQIISSGKNIVNELIEQVTATSEVTNVIIKDIEELERQSKSIGSVVGTINDIASTTNLLSLNASIEAARAGDAGRGFAVVAEQIRSLAEQSVDSVKSIEKIIKSIQQKTQTTSESANRTEQMLSLQTDALNRTVKVFQDVDSHMVELMNMINHITDNMQTITVSKDDVLDAIKNIAAVTQETLASSEVVDTNISNQIVSIETLNAQAEDMKERARDLEQAIAKFTI